MAENIIDILLVAYKLSVLTFYIGVLIYALPIPWRNFKKWGPTLIIDGILAMALTLGFSLVFVGVEEIRKLLGGSWEFYYRWVFGLLNWVLATKGALIALRVLLSLIPVPGLYNTFVAPIERSLDALYLTVGWLLGMAHFIQYYGKYLAAIGVALYAVPFRIARSAGAWMIAFTVVFSIGLPVMPSFVSSIAELPEPPDIGEIQDLGIALARLDVYDIRKHDIAYGVLYLYHEEYGIIAREKVSIGSVYDNSFGVFIPVPSRDPITYVLDVYDVEIIMEPAPMRPSDYRSYEGIWYGEIYSSHLVWAGAFTALMTTGDITDVGYYTDEVGELVVEVYLDNGEYVEIRYPEECIVDIEASSGLTPSTMTWEWYGLRGHTIHLEPTTPSYYNITIDEVECGSFWPDLPSTENMLRNPDLGWDTFDFDILSTILVYYITVPLIYVFILLVITFGLARLLGGRDRYIPRL